MSKWTVYWIAHVVGVLCYVGSFHLARLDVGLSWALGLSITGIGALFTCIWFAREYVEADSYQQGWDYASAQLDACPHAVRWTIIEKLKQHVDNARTFGDYDAFDRGIEARLRQL